MTPSSNLSEQLCTYSSILRVAIPAIFLNAAAPATITMQTALLGKYGGSLLQAAFAAVHASANLACVVFNFLVDGVSSKVGHAVGGKRWTLAAQRVQMSFFSALAAGGVAVLALLALKGPVTHLMELEPEVITVLGPYWYLRTATAPLVLLNMAISGVLQGYNRVGTSAALSSCQSLAEIGGSVLVLAFDVIPLSMGSLTGLGCVTFAAAFASAVAGLLLVVSLTPPDLKVWQKPMPEPNWGETSQPLLVGSPDAAHAADSPSREEHEGPEQQQPHADHVLDFLTAQFDMLVRSVALQATFFLAVVVAGRLGTASLAAHQVIAQCWVLTSYIVDGFAAAATVLGSRLMAVLDAPAATEIRNVKLLCQRLLVIAAGLGFTALGAFLAFQRQLIHLFTSDSDVIDVLSGPLWLMLCIVQPINAAVFVYDGLLIASQSFSFIRDMMLSGFIVAFCPLLAVAYWKLHTLWAVWGAKAAMNTWRLCAAAYRIHWQVLRTSSTLSDLQVD